MVSDDAPIMDLVEGLPGVVLGDVSGGETEDLTQQELNTIAFTPLSVWLQQALIAPLSAQ